MAIPSRVPDPVASVFPYETVAASQTAQVLGGAGNINDYISHLVITPAAADCGVVTLLDGATSIPIFVGGATVNLPTLAPFSVFVGARSVNGPWKVTTGANVSVVAVGDFT